MKKDKNTLPDRIFFDTLRGVQVQSLKVCFYQADSGNEPVRDFLRTQSVDTRKAIGEDIKTVQYGWPLGMPLVRKIEPQLWEVRCHIPNGIVRVFFTVSDNTIVLLHIFMKKAQKIPSKELSIVKKRLSKVQRGDK